MPVPLPTAVAALVCGGVQPSVVLYGPQISNWAPELLSAQAIQVRRGDRRATKRMVWMSAKSVAPRAERLLFLPLCQMVRLGRQNCRWRGPLAASASSRHLRHSLGKQDGLWQALKCSVLIFFSLKLTALRQICTIHLT